MIYLIAAILVVELVRLIMAVADSRNVRALNKKIAEQYTKSIERAKENEEAWTAMRKEELEGVRDLAKGSIELAKIFKGLKQETEVKE